MLCDLCGGSGSLVTFKPMQWWPCPKCGGQGVSVSGIVGPEIKLQKAASKRRKGRK